MIYSLTFKPPIDGHVKDGALWHVLNECARANTFSTAFFLRPLRAFLTVHFSKQPKGLIAAISQVNARASARLPARIPSAFGIIEIKPSLSKIEKAIIDKLEDYERHRLGLHDDFLYVTCRVAATDDRSAIDAAYRNIKFGLGMLNLITRGYGVSDRFGYPDAPIGKFLSASPDLHDRPRRAEDGRLPVRESLSGLLETQLFRMAAE
jgi:hypothetical protein